MREDELKTMANQNGFLGGFRCSAKHGYEINQSIFILVKEILKQGLQLKESQSEINQTKSILYREQSIIDPYLAQTEYEMLPKRKMKKGKTKNTNSSDGVISSCFLCRSNKN